MLEYFRKRAESNPEDIDAKHDYVTYKMNMDRLVARYDENKKKVMAHIGKFLPDVDMEGQWSVDIMQNGDDFWLIDMAPAETSAFYKETVPAGKRRPSEENWIPEIPEKEEKNNEF